METKRLKRSHATYPSLAVDDTDKDLDRRPEAEKREWGHRVIERTSTRQKARAATEMNRDDFDGVGN
jgi:hypothetical protein